MDKYVLRGDLDRSFHFECVLYVFRQCTYIVTVSFGILFVFIHLKRVMRGTTTFSKFHALSIRNFDILLSCHNNLSVAVADKCRTNLYLSVVIGRDSYIKLGFN